MTTPNNGPYQDLNLYLGDLHNHCNMSYGRGSFSDAMKNARLQLDFASVTIHAVWPDLPMDDPRLGYLVDYHIKGFARASENWPAYLEAIDQHNEDGKFVTFPSFEWHSSKYGDHCVYFKSCENAAIMDSPDLPSLRDAVRRLKSPVWIIPHHIGYKQGFRGINWPEFTDEFSPVAEIFSFHGLSESSEGPYPYLHSMGPRHEHGTAQYGWASGQVFGVVGSTDSHNSFPGSYGYGRLGVWSESLTRSAIWNAIQKRRTYALTGDRIELAFSLNGSTMGDVSPSNFERRIEVSVTGSDSIDYIDILRNNTLIYRENGLLQGAFKDRCKVYFEIGWGEGFENKSWDVALRINDGKILDVEPRFRGLAPSDLPKDDIFAYTDWQQVNENLVRFHTHTRPNTSLRSSSTEGMSLEIEGDSHTVLSVNVNEHHFELHLSELMTGSRTFNLGGFVSPAICFHRAVPRNEYTHQFTFLDHQESLDRDWYYLRVRQRNDQWAWSSPIWVEKPLSSLP